MLPKCLQNKKYILGVSRFIILVAALYAFPVYAADSYIDISSVSAGSILQNLATQIPQLMQMVTAIAYVMGFYFITFGIFKLKQYGEARTMMSHEASLKAPLIYLTIGALLLYLPTSVQVGMSTFWVNPNPYGYAAYTNSWGQFLNVCFLIIQFIGTIAFIKGLVILSHLGGQGQQGSFGRGLTHIIGGILCINIWQTVQVILVTLGLPPLS